MEKETISEEDIEKIPGTNPENSRKCESRTVSGCENGQVLGNNSGVAVVEVILILVVLIALVIIFRDQITSLVSSIWKSINGDAKSLL